MQKTLILNHLSTQSDDASYICSNREDGKTALLSFFKTVQSAINEPHGFDRYLISHKDFWTFSPSPDWSLENFIRSLGKTEQKFFWELRRRASKPISDFLSEELMEQISPYCPKIKDTELAAKALGYAACVEDIVAVSFATDECWNQIQIFFDWYAGDEKISPQEYDLGEFLYNVSDPEHLKRLTPLLQGTEQITREYWMSKLPTTCPQKTFWDWFDDLDDSVQKTLFRVACKIQEKRWAARTDSSFQRLAGRDNELCEIRCWPRGSATIRTYVKVESENCVIFLNGSKKDDQNREIERARRLYQTYKNVQIEQGYPP